MSIKNRLSNLLPKILFGFAVIGFILLWLMFGGRSGHWRYRTSINIDSNILWQLLVPAALVLPFLIYLFKSKTKHKKVLKSNPIDLSQTGLTKTQYFDWKAKENFVEIYIKNETSDKLIVNRKSLLEPDNWYVFKMDKYKYVYFSNGIEFHIDKELNLEIIDFRNQIIGLGDNYFKGHNVPEHVNFAFVITEPHKGYIVE